MFRVSSFEAIIALYQLRYFAEKWWWIQTCASLDAGGKALDGIRPVFGLLRLAAVHPTKLGDAD